MIRLTDVSKSFGKQKVLDRVNLRIADGELMAIIGRSGGGKSVLLKHLIGIIRPDAGSIVIDSVDITRISEKGLDPVRKKFGVVFQGGALFDSLSVFGNVAFPLREKTKMGEDDIGLRVNQALGDVGLDGFGDKYPAEISGGMKKRVALARALVTEPKIVLFDEPTTGLDPIMLHAIHKLITDAHRKYGFTGVIISHDIPDIFDVADRIAFLHMGRIEAVGTPVEIRDSADPVVHQFVTGSLDGPIEAV